MFLPDRWARLLWLKKIFSVLFQFFSNFYRLFIYFFLGYKAHSRIFGFHLGTLGGKKNIYTDLVLRALSASSLCVPVNHLWLNFSYLFRSYQGYYCSILFRILDFFLSRISNRSLRRLQRVPLLILCSKRVEKKSIPRRFSFLTFRPSGRRFSLSFLQVLNIQPFSAYFRTCSLMFRS